MRARIHTDACTHTCMHMRTNTSEAVSRSLVIWRVNPLPAKLSTSVSMGSLATGSAGFEARGCSSRVVSFGSAIS